MQAKHAAHENIQKIISVSPTRADSAAAPARIALKKSKIIEHSTPEIRAIPKVSSSWFMSGFMRASLRRLFENGGELSL